MTPAVRIQEVIRLAIPNDIGLDLHQKQRIFDSIVRALGLDLESSRERS